MTTASLQSQIKSTVPSHNLGTYSNVIGDDMIRAIMLTAGEMNFVDKGAYPKIVAMEHATARFLLDLAHGSEKAVGFATTGSSEAIVLAMAWHKHNFLKARPKHPEGRLNFVINRGYHKVFEKFATLFDVELRAAPLNKELSVDVKALEKLVDDNTFCIVGIAGSTELGMVDDIESLAAIADKRGVAMHVDAAIGGYVLPFLEKAQLWDFALPAVQTMNISGHKYGLCLPGIGFLLARDNAIIPKAYSGEIAYLSGGGIVDNALCCTRNAAFVVNAYHNMEQHGKEGYRAITRQNMTNATYFARMLRQMDGIEEVIQGDVPVVMFRCERIMKLSEHLSRRGWIQSPHFVNHLENKYIRVVVRRHITLDMLEQLLADISEFYVQQTAADTPAMQTDKINFSRLVNSLV